MQHATNENLTVSQLSSVYCTLVEQNASPKILAGLGLLVRRAALELTRGTMRHKYYAAQFEHKAGLLTRGR